MNEETKTMDICNPELAEELRKDYEMQLAEDIREEQNERLRGIGYLHNAEVSRK